MSRTHASRAWSTGICFAGLIVVLAAPLGGCDKRETSTKETTTRTTETPEGTKKTTETTERKTEVDPKNPR